MRFQTWVWNTMLFNSQLLFHIRNLPQSLHAFFTDSRTLFLTPQKRKNINSKKHPPFLKIVSGFRVTHIKKTHLDVLQKNLFQPDCHWGSGQTAAFFECKWSSSSSHTDRMIPERQNCGRKPTKNQGEAYCLPKFGRFFRKKKHQFLRNLHLVTGRNCNPQGAGTSKL